MCCGPSLVQNCLPKPILLFIQSGYASWTLLSGLLMKSEDTVTMLKCLIQKSIMAWMMIGQTSPTRIIERASPTIICCGGGMVMSTGFSGIRRYFGRLFHVNATWP